jgi:hypothetical protein
MASVTAMISAIPTEILLQIFVRVEYSPETFSSLSLVSRHFRDTVVVHRTQLQKDILHRQHPTELIYLPPGSVLENLNASREASLQRAAIVEAIIHQEPNLALSKELLQVGAWVLQSQRGFITELGSSVRAFLGLSYRPDTDGVARSFSVHLTKAIVARSQSHPGILSFGSSESSVVDDYSLIMAIEDPIVSSPEGFDWATRLLWLRHVKSLSENTDKTMRETLRDRQQSLKARLASHLRTIFSLTRLNGIELGTAESNKLDNEVATFVSALDIEVAVARSIRLSRLLVRNCYIVHGHHSPDQLSSAREMYGYYQDCHLETTSLSGAIHQQLEQVFRSWVIVPDLGAYESMCGPMNANTIQAHASADGAIFLLWLLQMKGIISSNLGQADETRPKGQILANMLKWSTRSVGMLMHQDTDN